MRKLAIILISTCFVSFNYGQSFEYEATTPYGIETNNSQDSSDIAYKFLFYDNDHDGDADLTLMGLGGIDTTTQNILFGLRYFIEYQENIGEPNSPDFATREKSYPSFQLPSGEGFMIPAAGDLNNDGLIDFVVSAETDLYGTQYLQFQIQNPDGSFTVTNCLDWNLEPFVAYSVFMPELTDLDSDGDLDILLGGSHRGYDEDMEAIEIPVYLYAKNIGTPEIPEFLGWFENPYGLVADGQPALTSGDLDLDGDIDIIYLAVVDDVSTFYYAENIGTSKPEFTDPIESPFGLPTPASEEEGFLFPSLVDIDRDGDLDFFVPVVIEEDLQLLYYKNTLLNSTEELIDDKKVILQPNPTDRIVQINNQTEQKVLSFEVYNSEGKLVFTSEKRDKNHIDFFGYNSGVYFVKIIFENSKLMKKVILLN